MNRRCLLHVGCCALLIAGGCGQSGPSIVPVEGVVTRNGAPLPNMMIWFEPSHGRPSWGISDKGGHFALSYDPEHKGAVVGSHTVWVLEDPALNDPTAMMGKPRPKRSAETQAILDKYGSKEQSPLKVEINKADRNFQLKLD